MSKTTITYKDVAVGAQEGATFSATGATAESSPALLADGASPGKIITLERDRWALDGSFDRYYEQSTIAFWSAEISGDDGALAAEPTITIAFDQQYSSIGISFVFDDAAGDYVSLINIKWYQGDTLIADQDFMPDHARYFCSKRVESYDKLIITLKKTYPARRRAKLNRIVFGIIRHFEMNDLRSASITNEMDESAIELPISTFNWMLSSTSDVDYMFQLKQPVEVRNNDRLLGVYYISGSSRQSVSVYGIECDDAIGVLSETPFAGGAYLSGVSAKTLLTALAEPFSVEYADDVEDTTLTGVLLEQTAREAIQQVIFAWGVCLATDGGAVIRVFNPGTEPTAIPQNRTFSGASVDTDAIVTKVSVTAHTYTAASNGNIKIGGAAYNDETTVYTVSNPNITASDRENAKAITDATLVSAAIGQVVANRVYAHYAKRNTAAARIVYGGERLGERISIYTPWGTLSTGILSKMEITLSNTVVYKAEVTGHEL